MSSAGGPISDRNATQFLSRSHRLYKHGSQSESSKALKKLFHLRYDPKKWLEAVEENRIDAKWLVGQLKNLIEDGKSGQRIAAFDRLLCLIESLGLAWDKVGEHFGLDPKVADGLRTAAKSTPSDDEEHDAGVQKKLDEPIGPLHVVGRVG